MHGYKLGKFAVLFTVFILISIIFTPSSYATGSSPFRKIRMGGNLMDSSSVTSVPPLFTGTFNQSIPIDVAPGRKGMQPGLALT